MKEKITSIIMVFVILGIIGVSVIFGMIVIEEISKQEKIQTQAQVEQELANTEKEENTTTISKKEEATIQNNIEVPAIIENPLDKLVENEEEIEETNANVDYDNVTVNKYFYNQLGEYAKTIYKAFESNKEQMKTGTYQIELGNSFTKLLEQTDGQNLMSSYYQSAIEAYIYDNPDVFYLSPSKMFLNVEKTTRGNSVTYRLFINSGDEANYLTDEFSSKAQIDNAILKIEEVRNQILQNKTGNTYRDIKMVHDYLVDKISYDTSISKPYIYNIYGALVEKVSVCEGYAKSMKYLLDCLNIPCTMVIGKGTNSQGKTENHAWNYVQIDGIWYALDATWDDPIVIGDGTQSQSSRYRYFLKGSNEMEKDHLPSGKFTENGMTFNYPTLSKENYE